MSLSTQNDDDVDSEYVLIAKLDNVRILSQLLKAAQFSDTAIICGSQQGLKLTVEAGKCIQANVFVQADLFQEFTLRQELITFKINLNILLECLNIFGVSCMPGVTTNLKMLYGGYGTPLTLLLEENGVLTDCSIKTLDADDVLNFDLNASNVVNKIIMKSECLREAFSELDMSSEMLQIFISPEKPHLRLSTFGTGGNIHVDYPKDSDVIDSFHCTQTQTNRYKISMLKPSVKPLVISQKVSIRTDDTGLLCLQYMIRTEDGHICFIDFYCLPLIETEEEELEAD